jgi:hypothetical protein
MRRSFATPDDLMRRGPRFPALLPFISYPVMRTLLDECAKHAATLQTLQKP